MLLGLCYVVLILGVIQPLLICNVTVLLAYPGFEETAVRSVEAHRRVRQAIFRWGHDDGIAMAPSGTKADVPRLLDVDKDENFGSCAGGHRDHAMECITNHSAGSTLADWKAWWEAHSHQTQAQWIMDGFKAKGIEFTLPPDHPTCLRLLKLLGRDHREQKRRFEENPPERSLPDYIILNIRRVLKHHDFDGSAVTQEDIAADPSGELLDGLKAMMKYRVANSYLSDPFDAEGLEAWNRSPSGSLHPATMWIHTLIAFLLFQSGFYLWLRARFRRRSQLKTTAAAEKLEESATPGHSLDTQGEAGA